MYLTYVFPLSQVRTLETIATTHNTRNIKQYTKRDLRKQISFPIRIIMMRVIHMAVYGTDKWLVKSLAVINHWLESFCSPIIIVNEKSSFHLFVIPWIPFHMVLYDNVHNANTLNDKNNWIMKSIFVINRVLLSIMRMNSFIHSISLYTIINEYVKNKILLPFLLFSIIDYLITIRFFLCVSMIIINNAQFICYCPFSSHVWVIHTHL